jgi:hypothetical protein
MASRVANSTSVHKLHRALSEVHELEHHRCTYEARGLVLHLYMFAVHELAHRPCMCVVRDLMGHLHDGHEVHVLELRRCTYEARELVPRPYMCAAPGLVLHHPDVRAVVGLTFRRCIYEVRGLDGLLRSDAFRLVFRRPYVVVFRRDSKRHYFACCPLLQRAVIQRGYVHLGREAHEEL